MRIDKADRQALLSWIFVSAFLGLSATLGVLQYRWIGEVSVAARERLRSTLQTSLGRLSNDFNTEVNAEISALAPHSADLTEQSRERAYSNQFTQWRESSRHNGLFRRVAVAFPRGESLELKTLDFSTMTFQQTPWPQDWKIVRERLATKLNPNGPRGGPVTEDFPALIERPNFGSISGPGPPGRRELDWLILELDLDYVRSAILPELLQRYLGAGHALDYDAEIVMNSGPEVTIYRSERSSPIGTHADASVRLFDVEFFGPMRGQGRPPRMSGPPGQFHGGRDRVRDRPSSAPADLGDRGRWLLSVRHRAGSLEAVVATTRRRNLAVSAAVLVLLMFAAAALLIFVRRAHKLAELQMEFVAGVSHELRTPLSVICTAGHNLQSGISNNPDRVKRYGALIQEEGEKLTAIVEQVLRFASAKTGHIIGQQEPLSVEGLIADAVEASKGVLEESRCLVEKRISPELPRIVGDPIALKHALQNLLSNAAKYGKRGDWIGISGSMEQDKAAPAVEIRVADHGPGMAPGEMQQIFDPFYRGKTALENQIHGTGLGLSLTKRIIEAHRGTITVESEQGKGSEFIVRIPVRRSEQNDGIANSVD
jgi:signal transduction histidine kinase